MVLRRLPLVFGAEADHVEGIFVAQEATRLIDTDRLPDEAYVCVVTAAELQAGVLAAADTAVRARRMATLERLGALQLLAIDRNVAAQWAQLRVQLRDSGRRMPVNDSWIAAVAVAHQLPLITQDEDFDVLGELGLLEVVRV